MALQLLVMGLDEAPCDTFCKTNVLQITFQEPLLSYVWEDGKFVQLPKSRSYMLMELLCTLQVSLDPGCQSQEKARKGRVMLEYLPVTFQKGQAVLSFARKHRQLYFSIHIRQPYIQWNFPQYLQQDDCQIVFICFPLI